MKTRCSSVIGLICSLMLLVLIGCSQPQMQELSQPQVVGQVGKSALIKAEDQYVLLLQGTHYEIGYAYGKLLAGPVKATAEGVLQLAQATDQKNNVKGSTLETIYQATEKYIPQKYKEEIKGLADGAGLDLHMVELVNLFPEMFHCSTFSMADKATKDGQLIHGRVLDYAVGTDSKLQASAIVIVMRPEGENASMMASYIGFLGCITGINNKELAVGMVGMGEYGKWEGFPMAYLLRSVLDEANTLEEALPKFEQAKRTCKFGYVISDGNTRTAAGIIATPESAEIFRMGQTSTGKTDAIPNCVVISGGDRYAELVKRIRENYGRIDVAKTIEIIKRPVAMECNLHNAVMLPRDEIMYVANAAVKPSEQPQACYQMYYKYDLKTFLAMMDQLAGKK